jgi:uncharacterized Zn-binding protein involved in type VI secretion
MGGPVLTAATLLVCAHGVPARAVPGAARVVASGVPVLCVDDPLLVDTCRAQSSCLVLKSTGSQRVRASGRPLAIAGSVVSAANGLPALIAANQQRVLAE